MVYDAIIIGGGPAGMVAAKVLSRSRINYLLIEKETPGGKALRISRFDNMPGLDPMSGYDFSIKLYSELRDLKAPITFEEVKGIYRAKTFFVVHTDKNDYEAKNVIYAGGSEHRKLYIPDEEEYEGRGLSFCALCDGNNYEDQDVLVLGGGDGAVDVAGMLSGICNKVYVVHRHKELKAKKRLAEHLKSKDNIEIIDNTILIELYGKPEVEGAILYNLETKETYKKSVKCVFAYVGQKPNTEPLQHFEILDEKGYVIVDNKMETSIPGLYAIGDCNNRTIKLIVLAVADAVIAATNIRRKI